MGLGLDMAYVTGAIVGSPVWGYRMARTGKWRTEWGARLGRSKALAGGRRLLIHAVSVGEVNAVRQLVKQLCQSDKQLDVVISSTTDTGIARARSLFEPRHTVVRYPFDLTCCVSRFLDAIKPTAAALVENEVWPNFAEQCRRRAIALCVVNGRLTHRSLKRYRQIKTVSQPMYGGLAAVAVQTEEYAQRFIRLGTPANRVTVLDTMKWDTAFIADHVDGAQELALAMGIDRRRPLIVAGSTGPGEEKLLIETCPKDAQLLLVPRKPERFEQVAQLAPTIVRRTQHHNGAARPVDDQRLFLLDTMGELRKAYALADVVIVGRSFLGLYGSDMIEPIALARPTVIGPHHQDFADIVLALVEGGGLAVTDQPGPFASQLLSDPDRCAKLASAGRDVILTRKGATQRHVKLLLNLLDSGSAT